MLLSGLALPLARRRRGRRVPAARLFGLAVIMTAAIIVTWEVIFGAATVLHTAAPARSLSGTVVSHGSHGLPIIAVSASIMVLVIAAGEALLHLVGVRPTPTPRPVEAALPVELLPGRHEQRGPALAAARSYHRR